MAASTSIPKGVFLAGVAIYAAFDFLLLVYCVRNGSVLGAVIAALLASTIPIALLASLMEHRSLIQIVAHYQDQSFAFLFGDLIFLPFAAAMAALAWRQIPNEGWRVSWQWTLASALIGLAAGLTFRYLMDKPNYATADAMGSFEAPTKLLHDFCAYPVLFGGLVCVGIPLFINVVNSRWPFFHLWMPSPYFWFMLVGIALWFAAGIIHDQHLVPQKLHPDTWRWPSKNL